MLTKQSNIESDSKIIEIPDILKLCLEPKHVFLTDHQHFVVSKKKA